MKGFFIPAVFKNKNASGRELGSTLHFQMLLNKGCIIFLFYLGGKNYLTNISQKLLFCYYQSSECEQYKSVLIKSDREHRHTQGRSTKIQGWGGARGFPAATAPDISLLPPGCEWRRESHSHCWLPLILQPWQATKSLGRDVGPHHRERDDLASRKLCLLLPQWEKVNI